jgi:hypothetical protein
MTGGPYSAHVEKSQNYGALFENRTLPTQQILVVQGKYILTQSATGLMAVHVRRARERLFFDRFLKALTADSHVSQQALFPVTVTVGVEGRLTIDAHSETLRKLGFDIAPFGPDSVVVNGVPEGWTVAGVIMLNSDGEGNYWGTWYDGVTGYTADENTTVYTVKLSDDQSKVTLSEVDDKTIPAGNAVVLKSTNATTIMTAAGGASGTLTNNDLLGADTEVTTPDNTYMLVKGGNGVGFYHWTKTHIPAGRGYLTLSSSVEVKEFLPFSDETTGISLPTPLGASTSFEGSIYDLTGRRMSNDTKLSTLNTHLSPGIYIINGRKVVIK